MSGGQYAAGAPGVATSICPKCQRLHARPARAPLPAPAPAPANGHDEGHEHEQAPEGHDQEDDDGHHQNHGYTPAPENVGDEVKHGHAPAPGDDEGHEHEGHGHRDGEGHAHDRGEGHEGHRHGEGMAAGRNGPLAGRWPYLRRELVAVVLSGVALGLGFFGVWRAWPEQVTTALFLVSILAGAVEIVPRGLRGVLRERSLDINFLITLAVLGAVLLGEYGEGATVVFLFALGEALEGITMARTRRAIEALMAIAPETAQVKASPGAPGRSGARGPAGAERTLRAEAVPVGSIVVVRPGDRIPLDGVVVEGRSAVDQAPITGESVPLDRAPGDAVFGGTINGAGYLEVRTTRPFAENTLSRIIHL
ncbi:MAG TPA: hypothetical protein VH257_16740, partial [Chloroflexota bacterium]|nr:hypothetical protein [Chloroflexota bacterium]